MNYSDFEYVAEEYGLQEAYNDQMIEAGKHWEQSMAERDEAQWNGDCFRYRELYKLLNLEVEKLYQQGGLNKGQLEKLFYSTLIIDPDEVEDQELRKPFK